MIKVSDYIMKELVRFGIKDIFMISGGGAMHLNDSIGKQSGLKYYCNHHEQASAIGAEGYARKTGRLAVVNVTSGPGGTNALTGVIGQWLDSVPVLYISGQVKLETTIESCRYVGLRQLGDQEINIVDIVKPVTKYAAMVKDPYHIKRELNKAVTIAISGRPGPVWLDIPLNVQGAMINEDSLLDWDTNEFIVENFVPDNQDLEEVATLIKAAKRPLLLAGNGIRISGGLDTLYKLLSHIKIPVVTSFNGLDLFPSDHKLFIGRIGKEGDRAGNFALQSADLLLTIGTRNNIRQISYDWNTFAKRAKKIVVDIDKAELEKPTLRPDISIHADAKQFLIGLEEVLKGESYDWDDWLTWCKARKAKYPVVLPEYKESNKVHPYYFVQVLTESLQENDCIVTGNGTASVVYGQAAIVKKGQTVIRNSGCAAMGYDLPCAIGACIADQNQRVICIAGDGSLQMNIQELATLQYYRLPVKVFVLNNEGYVSIKQTQDGFFAGRRVACDGNSGVGMPDFIKVAEAFGLATAVIDNHTDLKHKIQSVLSAEGPIVCDVRLVDNYQFSPKLSSQQLPDGRIISKPLEDMYPFLSEEEVQSNIISD